MFSATATWIARLSPLPHRAVIAGPATTAPFHAGLMRWCMRSAPHSPNVAEPSATSSSAVSAMVTRSMFRVVDLAGVGRGDGETETVNRRGVAYRLERVHRHRRDVHEVTLLDD